MPITITINNDAAISPEVLEALAVQAKWKNKEGKEYSARSMADQHIRGVLRQIDGYYRQLLEPIMPIYLWRAVFEYEISFRKEQEEALQHQRLEQEYIKLETQHQRERIIWEELEEKLTKQTKTLERLKELCHKLGKHYCHQNEETVSVDVLAIIVHY